MTIKLEVTQRSEGAEALRAVGKIPAIVYGPKQAPINLAIDKIMFEKMVHTAGESTIVTLAGLGEDIEVLIHEVSFDARKGGIVHADFYAIERGKELTTDVALEFIGTAPVEKTGATVTKVMHEIEVTCRPSVLPSHIDVDITVLVDTDSQIHVRDLIVPAGVTLGADLDEVVAAVSEAREAEVETVTTTEAEVLTAATTKQAE